MPILLIRTLLESIETALSHLKERGRIISDNELECDVTETFRFVFTSSSVTPSNYLYGQAVHFDGNASIE